MSDLTLDYCGEIHVLEPGRVFAFGRDADLVIDADNAFMHRRVAELVHDNGYWWVANVGSRLPLTVSGEAGTLESWVGPGVRLPIVLGSVVILFTAGQTTYELALTQEEPGYSPVNRPLETTGDYTLGTVDLTPSQFVLVLALAEGSLRRAGTGAAELPSNQAVAARLGWPLTTFNRKLDNVCDKFARAGVKGLRGEAGRLAQHRRSRLVEYAVAARIVRPDHLPLLDRPDRERR